MIWNPADDIKERIADLTSSGQFDYVVKDQVYCFRSTGSKSRAIARIWSLPKIWQQALDILPAYCLEVISERFDKLDYDEQSKVLVHELMHIPQTFSGALLSHRHRYRKINRHTVDQLFRRILQNEPN